MLRLILLPLIVLPLLAACATEGSRVVASSSCPSTPDYSRSDLNKAADELDALPTGSIIGGMIVDYGKVRKKLRKCNE